MISELSSVTSNLVSATLDASMLRHKIISNNIANNNVEGFKALDVNFESLLRAELSEKIGSTNSNRLEEVLNYLSPEINERKGDNMVGPTEKTLDQEMAEMAKNTLKYESLIKAQSLQSGILNMAITGSRNR